MPARRKIFVFSILAAVFGFLLPKVLLNFTPSILAFSIPLAGTFSELNISSMSFLSIKQVIEILDGWQIIYSESEEINYLFPNLIEALRSIKSVGANYCKNKTGTLPSRDPSPYLLKYNIGYFMVRKI